MKDLTLAEARLRHQNGGAVVARFENGTEQRLIMIGRDEVVGYWG
jgi:hypothetical protein